MRGDRMEIAALIISIVSLIATIAVGIYDKKIDKKISNISISSDYFNDLYRDILLKTIPQDRKKITIDRNGKLVGSDDLIDTLKSIRADSAYFLYTDKVFYKELISCVQELEDYIVNTENKQVTGEEQTEVFNNISNKITKIYSVMTQKCFDGQSSQNTLAKIKDFFKKRKGSKSNVS